MIEIIIIGGIGGIILAHIFSKLDELEVEIDMLKQELYHYKSVEVNIHDYVEALRGRNDDFHS